MRGQSPDASHAGDLPRVALAGDAAGQFLGRVTPGLLSQAQFEVFAGGSGRRTPPDELAEARGVHSSVGNPWSVGASASRRRTIFSWVMVN